MFQEILVVDYVTNYKTLTSDQIKTLKNGLINPQFLDNCPNGTIIGIPLSGKVGISKKIYFPFFSHIRMPIKAGERAWAFDQSSGAASYWLSRKVQNITAEDLNFTHDDRARIFPALSSDPDAAKKISSTFYDAKVSAVDLVSARTGSISRSEFVGEPVVPMISKSIDFTIQGSNGTAIRMSSDEGLSSGAIDIIAGFAAISTKETTENSDDYIEIIKPSDSTVSPSQEDLSRITVSQSRNADTEYGLPGEDSGINPTISIKTGNVRIYATNDLKIIVGNIDDPSSIILKNNGEIVITPSSTGVIKLGGDDASGALVATQTAVVTSGIVTGSPIIDTAGGIIGAEGFPQTGVFASRILVKV